MILSKNSRNLALENPRGLPSFYTAVRERIYKKDVSTGDAMMFHRKGSVVYEQVPNLSLINRLRWIKNKLLAGYRPCGLSTFYKIECETQWWGQAIFNVFRRIVPRNALVVMQESQIVRSVLIVRNGRLHHYQVLSRLADQLKALIAKHPECTLMYAHSHFPVEMLKQVPGHFKCVTVPNKNHYPCIECITAHWTLLRVLSFADIVAHIAVGIAFATSSTALMRVLYKRQQIQKRYRDEQRAQFALLQHPLSNVHLPKVKTQWPIILKHLMQVGSLHKARVTGAGEYVLMKADNIEDVKRVLRRFAFQVRQASSSDLAIDLDPYEIEADYLSCL